MSDIRCNAALSNRAQLIGTIFEGHLVAAAWVKIRGNQWDIKIPTKAAEYFFDLTRKDAMEADRHGEFQFRIVIEPGRSELVTEYKGKFMRLALVTRDIKALTDEKDGVH